MSDWFTKNLGDALLAREALDRIAALFVSEYGKTGCPAEAAVFLRHESEGRLHCEARVYFSPATLALAQTAGAAPCARPSPDGLSLLIGAEDSWSVLFPPHGG